MVFAKLVSLTQTFDSLGSINTSRHVASRKEEASGKGEARTRIRYPSTKRAEKGKGRKNGARKNSVTIRINYETGGCVWRVSLSLPLCFLSRLHLAYFMGQPNRRKPSDRARKRPSSRNEVVIFFRHADEKRPKNCLPQSQFHRWWIHVPRIR